VWSVSALGSTGIDGQDQEDRSLCQRAENGLRLGGVHLTANPTQSNIVAPVIVKPSSFGYAETVQRLSDALEERGLTVFARVDHAGAAREAGWTSRTRRSSCSAIRRRGRR
jgi:hypothetical protein